VSQAALGDALQAHCAFASCMKVGMHRLSTLSRNVGPLSQPAAERNVLAGDLVQRDHEIIRRDPRSRDDVVVQCLKQSQSLLPGTA
jgi:hypothetical protein